MAVAEAEIMDKVGAGCKINNFGSATLIFYMDPDPILHFDEFGSGSWVCIVKFLGDKKNNWNIPVYPVFMLSE